MIARTNNNRNNYLTRRTRINTQLNYLRKLSDTLCIMNTTKVFEYFKIFQFFFFA